MLRKSLIALSLTAGLCGAAYADTDAAPHSNGVGAAVSDTAITTKVKAQLMTDDRLKSSTISVTTINGVVTLTGSTPSTDTKSDAEAVVKGVNGVQSVDDQLAMSSSPTTTAKVEGAVSDSWITTKVKSDILADSVSKGFKVSVKTHHGVVMLKGTLPNQDAVDHVKDIASQVHGVKRVNAKYLQVQSS